MGSVIEALGISLPLALAIAASPGAIIAMLIMLMTRRSIKNSYAFLVGWFFGLMLVGMLFLSRPGLYGSAGEPSVTQGWIKIVTGAAVFITGLFMLKKISNKQEREAPPNWARKVDSFGFLPALITGFFFAAPNIKNASMVIASAVTIGNSGLSRIQEWSVLVLFCLVASSGVLVPPVIFLMLRGETEALFGKMKIWLTRYRVMILFAICIFFGGLFIYQGIHMVLT
jgi:hypothetical protein